MQATSNANASFANLLKKYTQGTGPAKKMNRTQQVQKFIETYSDNTSHEGLDHKNPTPEIMKLATYLVGKNFKCTDMVLKQHLTDIAAAVAPSEPEKQMTDPERYFGEY